jgi:hypothetical protein
MTVKDIILSIFEILLIFGVFAAIIFEYKLVELEDKIKEKIKKFLEVIR